jgi:integrase
VVEGARLESEYTSKAYRGFESLRLRQNPDFSGLSRTKINSVKSRFCKAFVDMRVRHRTPEIASRVRGRIERILDAAKAKGLRSGENPARGRGHLDLLLPKRPKVEVKHHAALPFAEIASFMVELGKRPAVAARALEFTILTAARSVEARGMTWSELDTEEKLWTVPGGRMKAGITHQVPLSNAAAAIVSAIKPQNAKPTDLVFAAPRGGAFSDMAFGQLLKRMGRADITAHGFRSSFRDWAGDETQFGREEVEMALAHTITSSTERAYRRGRALEKRRELMTAWADYCGYPQTQL